MCAKFIFIISELSIVSKIILPLCHSCSEVLNKSFLFLGHTVEYPLKEEFVQVEITIGGTAKNEYHAHVIKRDEHKRQEKKLNFALIAMDSVSNANFRRHMKKTYKFLKENPNTFIQKVILTT